MPVNYRWASAHLAPQPQAKPCLSTTQAVARSTWRRPARWWCTSRPFHRLAPASCGPSRQRHRGSRRPRSTMRAAGLLVTRRSFRLVRATRSASSPRHRLMSSSMSSGTSPTDQHRQQPRVSSCQSHRCALTTAAPVGGRWLPIKLGRLNFLARLSFSFRPERWRSLPT